MTWLISRHTERRQNLWRPAARGSGINGTPQAAHRVVVGHFLVCEFTPNRIRDEVYRAEKRPKFIGELTLNMAGGRCRRPRPLPTWDGSSPGVTVLPSSAANRISRSVPWHITEIRPDLSGNKFATDLSATLFLSCFRCTFLHRVACSNSLLNNSKRAQQSFSVVRPAAVRIPPSPPIFPSVGEN